MNDLNIIEQKCKKPFSWLFGAGLICMALYPSALQYRDDPQTLIFFPNMGLVLLMASVMFMIPFFTIGPKKIWIPLVLIYLFSYTRILLDWEWNVANEIIYVTMALMVYLGARYFGKEILRPFVLFTAAAAGMVLIATSMSITDLEASGYTYWPFSYTWLATFIGLGGVMGAYIIKNKKWRYLFLGLCLMALLSTRAPVAVIFLGFIAFEVIRGGYLSRQIAVWLAIAGVLFVIFWAVFVPIESERLTMVFASTDNWGEGRLPAYERAITDVSFFGHGFDRYSYQIQTGNVVVHQMPLVVLDQIGLIPAIAWLYVTCTLLFNKSYRFIWLAVIAFCILDYSLWTLFGHWWWAIVGISSMEYQEDMITEKVNNGKIGYVYS